jgi:sugar-specific transcriptional regulator TrmB
MNDNQIAIYLKCLEYGKTTASNLSSALGRERTSTLKLMQHMCERGYLSQTTERNSTYFMAIPFSILQEQFQQRQEEITTIYNNQDIILQEVQQLANPHQQDISIKIQQ